MYAVHARRRPEIGRSGHVHVSVGTCEIKQKSEIYFWKKKPQHISRIPGVKKWGKILLISIFIWRPVRLSILPVRLRKVLSHFGPVNLCRSPLYSFHVRDISPDVFRHPQNPDSKVHRASVGTRTETIIIGTHKNHYCIISAKLA